jgi:hypothetical protein
VASSAEPHPPAHAETTLARCWPSRPSAGASPDPRSAGPLLPLSQPARAAGRPPGPAAGHARRTHALAPLCVPCGEAPAQGVAPCHGKAGWLNAMPRSTRAPARAALRTPRSRPRAARAPQKPRPRAPAVTARGGAEFDRRGEGNVTGGGWGEGGGAPWGGRGAWAREGLICVTEGCLCSRLAAPRLCRVSGTPASPAGQHPHSADGAVTRRILAVRRACATRQHARRARVFLRGCRRGLPEGVGQDFGGGAARAIFPAGFGGGADGRFAARGRLAVLSVDRLDDPVVSITCHPPSVFVRV